MHKYFELTFDIIKNNLPWCINIFIFIVILVLSAKIYISNKSVSEAKEFLKTYRKNYNNSSKASKEIQLHDELIEMVNKYKNHSAYIEEKNKPRLIDEVIYLKNCNVHYAAKTKTRQVALENDLNERPKDAEISLIYPKGVYYDGEKTFKHRYNKPQYYITKLSFSPKNYLTFDQSQADENVIVKNQLKLDEITEVTDKHGKNYFILLTSEELDKKAAEIYGYKNN